MTVTPAERVVPVVEEERPGDGGVDRRVVWAHDRRSVGELLRDADHLARDMLVDVNGDQAGALLRTWGETVQAASEMWQSLPAPGFSVAGLRDAEVMARLQTHAQRMHRAHLGVGWPGDGPSDERLLRIAETFTRAAALIDRRHRQVTPPERRPAVRADVAAARARVVHTLHVASHGVLLSVRKHVDDERHRTHGSRNASETRAIPRGQEAQRRLEVFERLAGAYIAGRFVTAAAGEHQPPVDGVDRLQAALVRWDIQAHRVIVYAPTPANLALTAATQSYIAAATHTIVTAGAAAGTFDEATLARTGPALDATHVAWAGMAGRWRQLFDASTARTDPDLLAAAGEVRAASLEITHETTTPATSDTIAARVDIREAAHCLQQALSAAADLTHYLTDATRTLDTAVPARVALAAYFASDTTLQDDGSPRRRRGHLDSFVSPVDPQALFRNAFVPVPAVVRADLEAATEAAATAASRAMSSTSDLDRTAHTDSHFHGDGLQPLGARRHATVHVQAALPLPGAGWAR